jgi:HEAT repeat protein
MRPWIAVGAVAVVLVLASAPVRAGDEKKPPAAEEKESPEDAARAKELEKKLESPNKLDLIAAIDALGALNAPSARKVLMKFISETPNSEYGSKAVRALGKNGSPEVVDFLCGKDGARSTRVLFAQAACQSLADLHDKRAIPTLLECMKADKVVVVCAAIEAVVTLDPTADGLADRLGSLSTSKDDTVRRSVATALGSVTNPKAVPVLIAMAKDSNSIVRLNACKSIGKLAPYEARKTMEDLAAKDKNTEVRAAASEALARLPKEPPAPPPAGGKPGGGK